jgi:hypothetical protein
VPRTAQGAALRDGNFARNEGEAVRALRIYKSKGPIQPKRTALFVPLAGQLR